MNSNVPRVLVLGSGFAGFFAARTLERQLPPEAADLTIVSAVDHLCYSPLLPEVASGRLEARRIAIPLHESLHRTRIVQGIVESVDLDAGCVTVSREPAEPVVLPYDRLALTLGSVTRTYPTPGMSEHARGLKSLVEAEYIRDHVLRQLELADACVDAADRAARLTFVVVGAGYAGTETAAQLQLMTLTQLGRFPRLAREEVRWLLLDVAGTVLPELGPRLGRTALEVIRRRGMDVRLKTSVTAIDPDAITLSDGSRVPTYTVLWTAGVTPPPLVGDLGLSVEKGRLTVDAELAVQGRPGVWAAGDAASAPDPYGRPGAAYPPTAQHAQRQGVVLGHNIAASLGHGSAKPYRHRDLGLVADLGRTAAVARPLGIPLTGLPAKIVTKAYHLYALPSTANRLRVGADWLINLGSRPSTAQLGFVSATAARLGAAEHTGPTAAKETG